MDLSFDGAAAIFGGARSKRYALLIEDGKVKEAFVEPDNTGVNGESSNNLMNKQRLITGLVSAVDNVLK